MLCDQNNCRVSSVQFVYTSKINEMLNKLQLVSSSMKYIPEILLFGKMTVWCRQLISFVVFLVDSSWPYKIRKISFRISC